MTRYFDSQQLARASGRSLRTIQHHVAQGWLKAELPAPGVRGLRFAEYNARTWLAKHYPGAKLSTVPQEAVTHEP